MSSLLSQATSASYAMLLCTSEGDELRRTLLVRNAVMAAAASTTSSPSPLSSTSQAGEKDGVAKQRWMLMAGRAGLHPSDLFNDSDEDDDGEEDDDEADEEDYFGQEQRVRVQVQVYDYSSDEEEEEGEEEKEGARLQDADAKYDDESEWFEGLLQEVSAEDDDEGEDGMAASMQDDEGQTTVSSTQSLPSLIEDYSSGEEEDETGDAGQTPPSSVSSMAPGVHCNTIEAAKPLPSPRTCPSIFSTPM